MGSDKLQRRLYDAVFYYRYPQGSLFSSPLGNLHPSHRHRPVGSPLQRYAQFLEIPLRLGRKLLDTLTVDSCCSAVPRYLLLGFLKRLGSVHFVDQAEPFSSFDPFLSAANMRSFHTEASTHDQSLLWASAPCVATLRHSRRFALALLRRETHASTFLSSLPSERLCFPPLSRLSPLRYYGDSDSCAAHLRRRSPRLLRTPSCRSISNHGGCLVIASPTTPA